MGVHSYDLCILPWYKDRQEENWQPENTMSEKWDQHSSESKAAPNSTWCPHAFLEEGSPLQRDSFLATKGISLFSLTTIIFFYTRVIPFQLTLKHTIA